MLALIKLASGFLGSSSIATGVLLFSMLGMGGYIGLLKFNIWKQDNQIQVLENDVKGLELDVVHEKGNVKACQARIEETNNRIDDLKRDSDTRKEIIDMLGENIEVFREATKLKVGQLEDLPTPESCEDAMELLRKGAGE